MKKKAEGLTGSRRREWIVFSLLSSALYAFLMVLVILFLLREGGRRRVELEYRAWRVSSLVLESLYAGSPASDLDEGIIALGVYDAAGRVLQTAGKAPPTVDIAEDLGERIALSRTSVRVIRRIAWGGAARMRRLLSPFDRPGRGEEALPRPYPPEDPEFRGPLAMSPQGGLPAQGRILYVELGSGAFLRREALFALMGLVFLAGLLAAWILSLRLYRRVLGYAEAAQRDRELIQLGEAARTIAHEIKNPLGTIRLQCATLGKILPDERKRNLQVIEAQTQRLADLADRIGDFLRNPKGSPEALDIRAWLSSWSARHGLAAPEGEGQARVMVDPSRLESIMDNLLSNAREAMEGLAGDEGDSSDGGLGEGPALGLRVEGGRVQIEVADRGPGIDPALAERMWAPFFTTKARGVGIGLALVKRFVEEAGGSVKGEARPGGGTIIRIELPLMP